MLVKYAICGGLDNYNLATNSTNSHKIKHKLRLRYLMFEPQTKFVVEFVKICAICG